MPSIVDFMRRKAGGFDPNNPWGSMSGNQEPGIQGQTDRLLGRAGGAGLFDPTGSPLIRAQVRKEAMRRADARRRRGATLSQLLGLDPASAQAQLMATDREAAGDVSGAISEADLGQLMGAQDWYRNLYGGTLNFERQRILQRQAEREARRARGGIGSMVGTIGGAFLGGPGGAAIGSRLFGGSGGGNGGADTWGPGGLASYYD